MIGNSYNFFTVPDLTYDVSNKEKHENLLVKIIGINRSYRISKKYRQSCEHITRKPRAISDDKEK